MIDFMTLEICLIIKEENIDLLPSKDEIKNMIKEFSLEASSQGAEKITITPFLIDDQSNHIGYDIKYYFPPHTTITTKFYTSKEYPKKFSDHFSRIH
jgi:hypothetical protein